MSAAVVLPVDDALHRLRRVALGTGLVGAGLCVVGGLLSPVAFLRAYLVAYLFWVGIPLGCLAILMINYITGGAWGAVIRRLLEGGIRTLPLMAVLFLPVAAGVPHLYEWAHPGAAHDPLLQHKAAYLNLPFFLLAGRAIGRAAMIKAIVANLLISGMALGAPLAFRLDQVNPLFASLFGATAVGWNGVYLAEVARIAPQGQVSQATGGCLFFTFLGVVVTPLLFNLVLQLGGGYALAYALLGVPGLAVGARLLLRRAGG